MISSRSCIVHRARHRAMPNVTNKHENELLERFFSAVLHNDNVEQLVKGSSEAHRHRNQGVFGRFTFVFLIRLRALFTIRSQISFVFSKTEFSHSWAMWCVGLRGRAWGSMAEREACWRALGSVAERGCPWQSVGLRGRAWGSTAERGAPRQSVGHHGRAWGSVAERGAPWQSVGFRARARPSPNCYPH